MQVMIIEDQPLVVEGLRSVLAGIDSEPDIRCALLASRALSMLRSGLRPDLVMLDLNLPDAEGTSLLTSCAGISGRAGGRDFSTGRP
jgi:DNA-binding NarL/FixJ family response regulator